MTEPTRCCCGDWTLPGVEHVCPLELAEARARANNLTELAAARDARWRRTRKNGAA